MNEVPLPHIARAHRKRTSIMSNCIFVFCMLSYPGLTLIGRYTLSFVPFLLLPVPWLLFVANGIRVYHWKRSVLRRVFDKDRLKGLPCEHCLYDCTGNVSGQCPECAWVIYPDLAERWENWRKTFWLVRLRAYLRR